MMGLSDGGSVQGLEVDSPPGFPTGGSISGSFVGKVIGLGVGQLPSGISGDCTGLLSGVTYDGEAGDSGTSSNCGVGAIGVFRPVLTTGFGNSGSGIGLNGC